MSKPLVNFGNIVKDFKDPDNKAYGNALPRVNAQVMKAGNAVQNNRGRVISALAKTKEKVVDVASDVLSTPARAKANLENRVSNAKYNQIVATRNYKNRDDDSNKYKSTGYWAKNKN